MCIRDRSIFETGWEERLRNDLFCVKWDVKPQLNQSITKNHENAVNSSAFTYRILTVAQTQTDVERPKNIDALAAQARHKLLDQLHSSGVQPTS